jgi:prepilin peptidase CpaA
MPASNLILAVPLLSIVALATMSDLLDRRIPNGLSLGGAAIALLINAVAFGPGAFGLALLGWAVCLACFIPLYVSGGMAAGDVKLMAMVGAFLGPVNGFVACVCTLIAGAALAALCLTWRQLARRVGAEPQWATSRTDQPMESASTVEHALDKIPYAAAIALGATAAVLQPLWLTAILPVGVIQ